jgi:hypothetical protein
MGQPLSYHEFRSLHKGTPRIELSELWSKYKEGTYSFPFEDTTPKKVTKKVKSPAKVVKTVSVEETVEDVVEDVVEEIVEEIVETPWDALKRLSRECEQLTRSSTVLAFRHTPAELATMTERIREISGLTMPSGYVCTPTDSWKLWLGPTQFGLLVNTTRQVAFGIDRGWWRTHYQNTVYVDRELIDNKEFILGQVDRYRSRNRYIPRAPLVGVECKLPQGVKDIQLRGGQGQDR